MAKNNSIGVGVVSRNHMASEKAEAAAELSTNEVRRERQKPNHEFETLPMKVAHSHLYYRNHYVPQLEAGLKVNPIDWSVDQFFPNAKDGPLFVDLPKTEFNVEICRKKAKIMREAGFRYVFLTKGDTFETALLQLEGKLK